MTLRRVSLGVLVAFGLVWAGCGDDEGAELIVPNKPDAGSQHDAGSDVSQGEPDASDAAPDVQQPTTGPITAPKMVWTEIPFPNTQCRDGSAAGIRVSLNPDSDKLMIYFQGGGACFNKGSCDLANPKNLADTVLFRSDTKGIFNRNRAENPVKDWNWVYVSYCTGDVHAGNKPGGQYTDGGTPQQYVGYENVKKFLARIVPTVPNVKHVLQTGSSAGGFGAGLTAALVSGAFPTGTKFTLLDDSGPAFSAKYMPLCLQEQWRQRWGFDQSFIPACGADCTDPKEFSMPWVKHLVKAYPDSYGGIISSARDSVITTFFGFGNDDCKGDPNAAPTAMSVTDFGKGLAELRETVKPLSNKFGTFYIDSAVHVWLDKDDAFYDTQVDGVKLVDWTRNLLNGTAAHVGNPQPPVPTDAGTDAH